MQRTDLLDSEKPRHLGELFKSRRQELNLSLKDIENATSIRSRSLKAIEEGRLGTISPVYAKGFVSQYANFLGMDAQKVISDHPHFFASPKKQEFSYGIGTMEMRGSPGKGVKWIPNAFWIAMSVFVLLSAWALARFLELL